MIALLQIAFHKLNFSLSSSLIPESEVVSEPSEEYNLVDSKYVAAGPIILSLLTSNN